MKKITWRKFWQRDYTYHYVENCLRAFTTYLEKENLPSFKHMLFVHDDNGASSVYGAVTDYKLFIRKLHEKFTKNNQEIIKFKQRLLQACQKYLKSAQVTEGLNLSRVSGSKLLEFLENYYKTWLNFTVRVWMVWHGSEHFSELATSLVEKKARQFKREDKLPQYFKYISTPVKKSSILLLNEKLAKHKVGEKVNLDKLFQEFLWMPCGDLQGAPWSKQEFLDYVNNHQASKDELVAINPNRELHLNNQEKLIIKINKEMAYLRDYRDEIRRRATYWARFLYQEAARRFQVNYKDLMFYSTPEVFALFSGKRLSARELERRKGEAIILIKNKKLKVLAGKEMNILIKFIAPVQQSSAREIRGLTACKGLAQGSVKIIKLNSDLIKIKKGDIMVAVTTHPDYVSKMQLAGAIVTDEGGLTCHAAIVSRELGVPCIVGTKIATSVFKDGQLIEVDANRGVVKLIK